MNKVNKCIITLSAIYLTSNNAMQQETSLTDLPQPVIRLISNYLVKRRDYTALAATCRYLHSSATPENVQIPIFCSDKRKSESARSFLDNVFICMQHIIARNGNNRIDLHLSGNNLADDMPALSDFLLRCSQPPVGTYLAILRLGDNQLHAIPEGLRSLSQLKELDLYDNLLKKEDLHVLETYINESLKKLKTIDISNNPPLKISDVYDTLAHCETLDLVGAWTDDIVGYIPTPEQQAVYKAGSVTCSY